MRGFAMIVRCGWCDFATEDIDEAASHAVECKDNPTHCCAFMDEQLLIALASPSFRCLRKYGDRWGITHVSFDGVSVAEIFDANLDSLLETWVELSESIELARQGDLSDEHNHDWYKSIDGGTEICRCGAWR